MRSLIRLRTSQCQLHTLTIVPAASREMITANPVRGKRHLASHSMLATTLRSLSDVLVWYRESTSLHSAPPTGFGRLLSRVGHGMFRRRYGGLVAAHLSGEAVSCSGHPPRSAYVEPSFGSSDLLNDLSNELICVLLDEGDPAPRGSTRIPRWRGAARSILGNEKSCRSAIATTHHFGIVRSSYSGAH